MTDYSDMIDLPRPRLHHIPMEIRHRAKQFAPFAALKGFEECIHAKEDYILPNEPVGIQIDFDE